MLLSIREHHKKFHNRDLYDFLTYKLFSNAKNKIQTISIEPSGIKYLHGSQIYDIFVIPKKLDVLTGFSYKGMKIGDVVVYEYDPGEIIFEQIIDTLPIQPFLITDIWLGQHSGIQTLTIYAKKKLTIYGVDLSYHNFLQKPLKYRYQFSVFFYYKNKIYVYCCGIFGSLVIRRVEDYEPLKLQNKTLNKIYTNSCRKRYNSIFINFY